MRNTKESYGKVAIILHWLMALMVIGLVFIGFALDDIEKPLKFTVIGLHKATGVLVLIIGLFRWYWMLTNESPAPVDGMSKAEIGISHATKWILMLMLIGMPMSGIIMSMLAGHGIDMYGMFSIDPLFEKDRETAKIFGAMHGIGGRVLALIIVLHLLASLKHHFISKDNVLKRMLGMK